MTATESIKLAAVVATGISILVTILLYLVKEWRESTRRRNRAATTLALHAVIVRNSLVDHSEKLQSVDIKELLENAQDVIHISEAAELLFSLEQTLRNVRPTIGTSSDLTRDSRAEYISCLNSRIHKMQKKFELSPYFNR